MVEAWKPLPENTSEGRYPGMKIATGLRPDNDANSLYILQNNRKYGKYPEAPDRR
jgi:hypothetical protein